MLPSPSRADKVLDIPVEMQRQVSMIQKVLKTVDVSQDQFIDQFAECTPARSSDGWTAHLSSTPQVHFKTPPTRHARTSWCSDCRVILDPAAHGLVPAGHSQYTRGWLVHQTRILTNPLPQRGEETEPEHPGLRGVQASAHDVRHFPLLEHCTSSILHTQY